MENSILLVHINSYFITNRLHGELVKKLDLSGNRQIVYIPVKNTADIGVNVVADANLTNFIYSKCFNRFTRYLWPVKIFQICKNFNKNISATTVSVIHAHSLFVNGLIAYLYYRRTNIPYIVTVRNTDINLFLKNSFFFRKLGEEILMKAKGIVVLSPAYKVQQLQPSISKNVFQNIQKKISVIPNGIHDFWINNINSRKKTIENPLEILFVGKIRKNKNLEGLISACNILSDRDMNIVLNIAGDGPLRKKILSRSYKFSVNYLGFVPAREELIKIYRRSHILVVPSFRESFGLVYVEAMSQGLPVIYTKGQGFDGFFPNGHIGYSIDPHNVFDIASKIELVVEDYESISFNAANETKQFSWTNSVNKLVKLYSI